jgi:hypothetical protein
MKEVGLACANATSESCCFYLRGINVACVCRGRIYGVHGEEDARDWDWGIEKSEERCLEREEVR